MKFDHVDMGPSDTFEDVSLSPVQASQDSPSPMPRPKPAQLRTAMLPGVLEDQFSPSDHGESPVTPPRIEHPPSTVGRSLTGAAKIAVTPLKSLADELSCSESADWPPSIPTMTTPSTVATSAEMAVATPSLLKLEITALIKEVEELRILTKYQAVVIKEYEQHHRLDQSWVTTSQVSSETSKTSKIKGGDGTWIGGVWLSLPQDKALLGDAEAFWVKREYQRAMAILSVIIQSELHTKENKVKARLLKGVVLRDCGEKCEALTEVEAALAVATKYMLWPLVGVAQFQRGVCLFHIDKFAEASFCFTLAACAKDHEDQVNVYKELSEKMRAKLTGRLRYVGLDFDNGVDCDEVDT